MKFYSDEYFVAKGFKFDVICKDPSENEEIGLSQSVVITNANDVNSRFAKEVSCLSSTDTIHYRYGYLTINCNIICQ